MRFRVKGIRGMSEVAILPVEAMSEDDACAHARRQGYEVISVHRAPGLDFRFTAGRGRFPVVRFSHELIALLKAGLTLVEAIEIFHRKEEDPAHKNILAELLTKLRQGMRFSDALESFPLIFSPLYVATVRASERTSAIHDALARYVDYQSQLEKVRAKIVSAAIYPALLLVVGGLVTLFLLGYVVPRFSRIYDDLGGALPLFSRWLMQGGQIIDQHGALILFGVMALGMAGYYAALQPRVRTGLADILWRLPVLCTQQRLYELGRFYRTMGMLLRSGLPILPVLDMAKGLLSPALKANLDKATQEIRAGRTFSEAMSHHGLTTTVAHSMITVAERSGDLSEMLDVVADFHEQELARRVDWFSRLFEPLLMAVIGIVIGLIVVFMYMPIFELAETIQ